MKNKEERKWRKAEYQLTTEGEVSEKHGNSYSRIRERLRN